MYDGIHSPHRRRRHGRPPTGLSGHRFLGFLQNHDQVGNRAQGERMSQLVSLGRLKIGAALVLTSPFVPMLFQGEEWGASTPFLYFTAHPEPELATAVREGRRKEFAGFGWKPEEIPDPQARATFETSRLNWKEAAGGDHADLLDWHRRLIRLRQEEPALADGRMDLVQTDFDETAHWFKVQRGPITVACNLGSAAVSLPVGDPPRELLLASDPAVVVGDSTVNLPADSVAIWKCRGS